MVVMDIQNKTEQFQFEKELHQSFPENYVFYSNSQGNIAKMLGNAVPPKLAKAVGEVFINTNEE
jgi:site-specific DNA-cytosine methylase